MAAAGTLFTLIICGSAVGVVRATGADVLVQHAIEYTRAGGQRLLIDIASPRGAGPYPALLLIHGGGWKEGATRLDAPGNDASSWARRGYVAVAVDYRVTPDHPYPAAIEDLEAAVRWLRAQADELHVDPARIGALGYSAGGHLAVLLATRGDDQDSSIAAAVSYSGPMDLVAGLDNDSRRIQAMLTSFLACTGGDCVEPAAAASPLTHVDASDPPIFLAHSRAEFVEVSQATAMAAALEAAGVEHELVLIDGDVHVRYGDAPTEPDGATVDERARAFLDHYLGATR